MAREHRGRRIREYAFCLTLIGALALALPGCRQRTARTPAPASSTSPSGKYVVEQSHSGPFRVFTFSDSSGTVITRDVTDFSRILRVYTAWDGEDRFWLYNSDNGWVWFWEYDGSTWQRTLFAEGPTKKTDRNLKPPSGLNIPHYEERYGETGAD